MSAGTNHAECPFPRSEKGRHMITAVRSMMATGLMAAAVGLVLVSPLEGAPVKAGLELWLDANDASTLSTTNVAGADRVTQWQDKSLNANHAQRAGSPAAATHPEYVTTTSNLGNGRPAVRYTTGTDQILITQNNSPFSGTSFASTVFSVVRINSAVGNYSSVVSQSPINVYKGMSYVIGSTQGGAAFTDVWKPHGRRAAAAVPTGGTGQIVTWEVPQWATNPTTARIYYDGAAQTMSTYGTSGSINLTANPFRIGNWDQNRPTDDMVFPGDVGEVIVYSRVVNTAERIITDNYLGSKYDISPIAVDRYDGDTTANGDFDLDVFGVGRRDDGPVPGQVTSLKSAGLGIDIAAGLDDDEFIMAGHREPDNARLANQWGRVWYVDPHSLSGDENVTLTFDFLEAGLGTEGPEGLYDFKLLFSATDPDALSPLGFTPSVGTNQVSFALGASLEEGYYTLGFVPEPATFVVWSLMAGLGIGFGWRRTRKR